MVGNCFQASRQLWLYILLYIIQWTCVRCVSVHRYIIYVGYSDFKVLSRTYYSIDSNIVTFATVNVVKMFVFPSN